MHNHESEDGRTTPEATPASRLRIALPAVVFALVFAALLTTLWASGLLEKIYDKEALRAWVASQGALAPLVYVGFLMFRPFTFVPSSLFAPVAWALFGVTQGALLKVAGESCGASLAFLASRYGLRDFLERTLGKRRADRSAEESIGGRLGKMIETRGLRTVLALRFNLLIPFDALNYGLGLTRVRFSSYALGTVIGILPGTFLYVALAGSALEGKGWNLAFVLSAIAIMVWLSIPLARDLFAKREA